MRESTRAPQPESHVDSGAKGADADQQPKPGQRARVKEIGGAEGPEPTRYGDWERNGRCTDF